MISVTESAKGELARISSQTIDQPETVLRLIANAEGQLSLIADTKKEGDQLIDYQEITVLVVDEELSTALEGIGIDCQDTDNGPRLFLIRTNVEEANQSESTD